MDTFLQTFKPSKLWTDCYPIGNAHIGVMDFCNPKKNYIYLNDDTFWSGTGRDKSKDAAEAFKRAQAAMLSGDADSAENIAWKEMLGEWTEAYMPVGKFVVTHSKHSKHGYFRKLDINSAVLTYGTADLTCTSFVSYPDKVYVLKFSAKNKLTSLFAFDGEVPHNVRYDGNIVTITQQAPSKLYKIYAPSVKPPLYDGNGIRLFAALKIVTDGTVESIGSHLKVENYSNLELYYSSATSFSSLNAEDIVLQNIRDALSYGYDVLLQRHIEDYTALYNRVQFQLNDCTASPRDTVASLKSAAVKPDDALVVTLYNFGRYLTIASSRKGTQAANLQGIWSKDFYAPWASNYTININTEMNYWGTLGVNLDECYSPLIELIKKIAKNGENAAQKIYGMRGWTVGHNSDIWGQASPVGGESVGNPRAYGPSVGCAGWLCLHLYERYLYTLDKDYLAEVLPIMEGAARFYLDYLTAEGDAHIMCPSSSPENSYRKDGVHSLCRGSTFETAVVRTLFRNYLECAAILKSKKLVEEITAALPKLSPYRISAEGYLQEWEEDYPEMEITHRHLSHLYGLHPEKEIDSPELIEACKKTLLRRGDGGTGWSLAWKVNMYARLKDGNHAYAILKNQLHLVGRKLRFSGGGSYSSLLGAHPPFQIDSNFGVMAGITEMLVQSHGKEVEFLPALPDCWKSGKLTGVRIRGNKTVDIEWKDGVLTSSRIY